MTFDVIVASIKLIGYKQYHSSDPDDRIVTLPLEHRFDFDAIVPLIKAMESVGISDSAYQFDSICCDTLGNLLSFQKHDWINHIQRAAGSWSGPFTIHCPYCGEEVQFTRKILAEFSCEHEVVERKEYRLKFDMEKA